MAAWLSLVFGLAGKIFNGVWSKIPTGIWRGCLVILIISFACGFWTVYNKVNAEMVTKDAFAKSCEDTDKKIEGMVNQVKEVVTDLKDEIVGYRKDLQHEQAERIRALELELEKSRRRVVPSH